jgi:hypothetical protein
MDTKKLTVIKTGKTTVMTFAQTPKQNSAALLLLSQVIEESFDRSFSVT